MDNMSATYVYRSAVKRAFAKYRATLRRLFVLYGEPIPLSGDCALGFQFAWADLQNALTYASVVLDWARQHLGIGQGGYHVGH
jgi:hypothetical protein